MLSQDGVSHLSHLAGALVGSYCGYAMSQVRVQQGFRSWLVHFGFLKPRGAPMASFQRRTEQIGRWLRGDQKRPAYSIHGASPSQHAAGVGPPPSVFGRRQTVRREPNEVLSDSSGERRLGGAGPRASGPERGVAQADKWEAMAQELSCLEDGPAMRWTSDPAAPTRPTANRSVAELLPGLPRRRSVRSVSDTSSSSSSSSSSASPTGQRSGASSGASGGVPRAMAPIWEVVGGVDKGGILVRAGRELSSPEESSRLSTGALIRQEELQGERLRYTRLQGTGPLTGWAAWRSNRKDKDEVDDQISTEEGSPVKRVEEDHRTEASNAPLGDVSFDDEEEEAAEAAAPEPVKEPEPVPAAAEAPPGEIVVGCQVEIKGLKSKPELNGKRATALSLDAAAGRWEAGVLLRRSGEASHVRLDGPADERVRCKPENLQVVVAKTSPKKQQGDANFKEPHPRAGPHGSALCGSTHGRTARKRGLAWFFRHRRMPPCTQNGNCGAGLFSLVEALLHSLDRREELPGLCRLQSIILPPDDGRMAGETTEDAIESNLGADHENDAPQMLKVRVDAEDRTEIMRAVPLSRTLRGVGRLNRSCPVEEYEVFFSHTWHTAGLWKFLSLSLQLSFFQILLWWLVSVVLVQVLFFAGVLPQYARDWLADLQGYKAQLPRCIWTVFLGPPVSVLAFFSAPYLHLRRGEPAVREVLEADACICIYGLGGFLKTSKELRILWSPPYFSRLWCVFEVAAYRMANPHGKITVKPLFVTCRLKG
eukprot:g33573.t1